ncbi:MATH and LRR domain-containing protein PFE0570w [Ceratitis capitata]|uniref:MATH and LRR domain-containing protein PFE0570w n=1 Tax=Ceratitis capitata TaxID=7213 RepID=UPI0003299E28|nr:MATH and LRR domain-containing protein PFE0570w [Ceratitis capitata]XP_012158300.1 MATH and LRR domain-containing protein PFE0570w [Ceratitis capitata]
MSHLPDDNVRCCMWKQLMYRWFDIKKLITVEILNRISKLFELREQIEEEKRLLRESLTNCKTKKEFFRRCRNIAFQSDIEEPEVEIFDLILVEEAKQVTTLRTALRCGKISHTLEYDSEDDIDIFRNEVDKVMDDATASIKRYIASVGGNQRNVVKGAASLENPAKRREVVAETITADESDVEEIEQCRMLSQGEDSNDVSFASFSKRARIHNDDKDKTDDEDHRDDRNKIDIKGKKANKANKDDEENDDIDEDKADKRDSKENENVERTHGKDIDDDDNDDNDSGKFKVVAENNEEDVDEDKNTRDYSAEEDNTDRFKRDNFDDNNADNDSDDDDYYFKEYIVCGISPADLISSLTDDEQVAGNDNEERHVANYGTIEVTSTAEATFNAEAACTAEATSTAEVTAVVATSDNTDSSSDETDVLHIDLHCPDCGKFIVTQEFCEKHEDDTDDTCSTCGNRVSAADDSVDERVTSLLRERVEKIEEMREPGEDNTLAYVYIRHEINVKSFFENDVEWTFLGPSRTKIRKSVIQEIDWDVMKSSEIINVLLEILFDEKTLATHNVLGITPVNYPDGVEILKLPEEPLEDLLYLLFMAKGFTPRNGVKVINKKCDEIFWKKRNNIFLKSEKNLYDENENKMLNSKSESESEID